MTNATAGLIAFGILAILTAILFALVRMSESGHGSRAKDLAEFLKQWREAESKFERVVILLWFLRALFRIGLLGASVTVISALALAAAQIFGGGWEIARQILCDVLRFIETIVKGKATSCEPAPVPAPPTPGTPAPAQPALG
jgi:hypothetical protein